MATEHEILTLIRETVDTFKIEQSQITIMLNLKFDAQQNILNYACSCINICIIVILQSKMKTKQNS